MKQALPSTMIALQLDEPGGTLSLRRIPVPRPQAGQVLIRIAAAPVNPSDLSMLAGTSPNQERRYPFTPGIEGSGTVIDVGAGLMPYLLNGRRVACSAIPSNDGTWAEYMVTAAKYCAPLNKDVPMDIGAMLLVNPLTALAFLEIAEQNKHRAIVSTAAASAMGGMLLSLGKLRNVPMIHIVRRPAQVELVKSRGGEYVLNSNEAGFTENLRDLIHTLQASLVLDAIGGQMTQQLAEAALQRSTLLLYGRLSGESTLMDPRVVIRKDLTLRGWYLANWIRNKSLLGVLRLTQQAQRLITSQFEVPIHKRLPLSDAEAGIRQYVQNMSAGKILLVADPRMID